MSLIVTFRRTTPEPTEIADYDVEVLVTASPTELVRIADRVTVTGHRRGDGWPVLLVRFLEQYHPHVLPKAHGSL